MAYENRENIEWTNTWISSANCNADRCLLIGDSVTRELRGKIESFLHKWMKVDLFAASFAITDDMFWKHLECFLMGGGITISILLLIMGFIMDFLCNVVRMTYMQRLFMKNIGNS